MAGCSGRQKTAGIRLPRGKAAGKRQHLLRGEGGKGRGEEAKEGGRRQRKGEGGKGRAREAKEGRRRRFQGEGGKGRGKEAKEGGRRQRKEEGDRAARTQHAAGSRHQGLNEGVFRSSDELLQLFDSLGTGGGEQLGARLRHENVVLNPNTHNRPVLRIRDVYPGSRIRLFSIPDPGSS